MSHLRNMSELNNTSGDGGSPLGRDKFKGPKVVWQEALPKWGMAWELHVYGYAISFFFLFAWCLVHAIKASVKKGLPSRAYYVTMHILVALCSFGRSFYLLTLMYGTRSLVPKMVGLLPKFAMFPCITSSFILLFAVFIQLTKMQLLRRELFSPWKLISITVINFLLAYTVDILAEIVTNGAIFYFICDAYFVTWGLLSSVAYFYVFLRFYMRIVVNRQKLNKLSMANPKNHGKGLEQSVRVKNPNQNLDTALPLAAKITVVAGLAFFLIGAVNVYKFVNMFMDFQKEVIPPAQPWSWWIYNTFMRGVELVMNAMIAFVASLPFYEMK